MSYKVRIGEYIVDDSQLCYYVGGDEIGCWDKVFPYSVFDSPKQVTDAVMNYLGMNERELAEYSHYNGDFSDYVTISFPVEYKNGKFIRSKERHVVQEYDDLMKYYYPDGDDEYDNAIWGQLNLEIGYNDTYYRQYKALTEKQFKDIFIFPSKNSKVTIEYSIDELAELIPESQYEVMKNNSIEITNSFEIDGIVYDYYDYRSYDSMGIGSQVIIKRNGKLIYSYSNTPNFVGVEKDELNTLEKGILYILDEDSRNIVKEVRQ